MLVLTRKQGDTIQVGDEITVKVIKTGKGTVKIGIEAPSHVKVLRGELHEKEHAASHEPVLFQRTAGRPVAVDFAGYVALPHSA